MNAPVSRAEEIAQALRAQIMNGKYEPGERLPSERELSVRVGANRASVREALKKLEQLGMIAIRPGGGARVLPLEEAGLGMLRHALSAKAPKRELVAQWLDVHEIVIAGAARFAVERGTDEEFGQARALLRRLAARSTSDEQFVATVDALTELVAVASRNVVLRMVRNSLTAEAARQAEVRRRVRPDRKTILPMIRELEQALDERDAALAEEAVRRLLRTNRGLILDIMAGPDSGN